VLSADLAISEATVTITVDTPPVATNDVYSTCQDSALNVTASGVLSNDTDADNNPITAVLVSSPHHAASFTLNANGSFSYTPVGGYNGPDSFSYKANDGIANSNLAATVNITVNATPATPTAANGGPYCAGGTIALSTPTVAGATYSWTGPNGFTSSVQNPTRVSTSSADGGTYSVTVTTNGCTSAAATTNVNVFAAPATPTISAGGPITFCAGGSVTLTSSSATNNQWRLNGSTIGFGATFPATTGGSYTVIVVGNNGCASAP